MRILTRGLAILAFWLTAGFIAAGDIRLTASFERLSQEQGLSNNAVHCILQDRRGFLWVGTADGLNRYDGLTFKVYRHHDGDPASLPNNFIRTLYEAPDGTLWIGTDGLGLCAYKPQQEAFVNYAIQLDAPHRRYDLYVTSCHVDAAGLLWAGTQGGLLRLDPQTGASAFYAPNDSPGFSGRGDYIRTIMEDTPDRLLVGSEYGVLAFDRHAKRFSVVVAAPPPLKEGDGVVRFNGKILGRLADGRLCLNFVNSGVFLYDPATERIVDGYDLEGRRLTDFSTLPRATLRGEAVCFDPHGTAWIARREIGLGALNIVTGDYTCLTPNAKRPGAFSSAHARAVWRDRSGVLWVGDEIEGLFKCSPTRNRFELHRHHPVDETSLAHSYIRGVLEDRQGRLWVCLQFGEVCRLDRRTGRATRYPLPPKPSDAPQATGAYAVYEDRRGALWVGLTNGLHTLDAARGVFRPFRLPGLLRTAIHAIYEDAFGGLWVGTARGLFEIAPDRRRVTSHAPAFGPGDAPLGDEIQCIYEDRRDGRLWVGTMFGCIRYDPARREHRRYVVERRPEYGVVYVTGFAEGADGALWMVTKGAGLCRFDAQRETFTHITEKDGLPHNNCYAMFPDAEGYFWLSSDAGISRFDPARMTFRTYTPADGLQGREFNRFSAFQNAKGEIFFGGVNGLNIFHPGDLADNLTPPPVVVTELRINGQARPAAEGMRLTLDHAQNALDVGYAGLDFHVPEDNRYRYWLEGFDRGWREVGTRREASYTNLPPGRYRFWVTAANHDGVWSAEKLLLEMEIRPPWWRTWPAYFGFALAGGMVIYGGVRLRLRRLVARNRMLELKVAERTQEVTRKNEELAARNAEIEARNREIEAQRRNMLESLTYAQTIQRATLPTEAEAGKALGEHFVLWKPKDIVSGDFYWVHRQDGQVILAVADCTGHGVPGAFMSMIGNDLLGQIVIEQATLDPARILLKLHHGIQRALKQRDDAQLPDGMDAAVCRFDTAAGSVTFAGARRPLYVVADGTLTEIKGDRHVLGGSGRERRPRAFTNHTVELSPRAMLYLTTDGFADQPDAAGKKFGTRRLRELLTEAAGLPAAAQRARLEAALAAHMGDEPQRDDITVVGVRRPTPRRMTPLGNVIPTSGQAWTHGAPTGDDSF